jgi:hypothetical protein
MPKTDKVGLFSHPSCIVFNVRKDVLVVIEVAVALQTAADADFIDT